MIKNIFRLGTNLVVTLSDGTEYKTNKCTDEMYSSIKELENETELVIQKLNNIFYPEQAKVEKEYNAIKNSKILVVKGNSAYIPTISNLTVPQMLANKIAEAEERNDEDALTAYKNFWTLLSLNPNSEVRDNLFWFLNKWGMSVCKSGLIVAYRNVNLKSEGIKYNQQLTEYVSKQYYNIKHRSENPSDWNVVTVNGEYYITEHNRFKEDEYIIIGNLAKLYENIIFTNDDAGTVYTDNYTHTMQIRLGHIVSMPRSKVDEDVNRTCSVGLHAGAKGWLKYNYCGNIGVKVLINPADICSCPREDNYGKLRTCAYYPIQVIEFDSNGDVSDETVPDGFEVDFLNKISYEGTINNVDNDNYKLEIPKKLITTNIEETYQHLREIAKTINRKV